MAVLLFTSRREKAACGTALRGRCRTTFIKEYMAQSRRCIRSSLLRSSCMFLVVLPAHALVEHDSISVYHIREAGAPAARSSLSPRKRFILLEGARARAGLWTASRRAAHSSGIVHTTSSRRRELRAAAGSGPRNMQDRYSAKNPRSAMMRVRTPNRGGHAHRQAAHTPLSCGLSGACGGASMPQSACNQRLWDETSALPTMMRSAGASHHAISCATRRA